MSTAPSPTPPWPAALLLAALLLTACDGPEGGAVSAGPAHDPPRPTTGPIDPAAFETARNEAFRLFDAGGHLGEIKEALEAARALDPTAYGVNWRLGQVLADLKLHSEALACYRAAWEARPEDSSMLLKMITLQAQLGLHEEALLLLPRLREDPALTGEALFLEARMHDMRGDRDRARELLAGINDLPPALAYRGQSLLGRFLMQEGDLQAAREQFERALDGRPDYKEALKGMADTSRRLGLESQAAHWDEVLSLVLQLTDDAYARQKKEERREQLERLVAIHPAWDEGFKQLADVHRRAGDMDAACDTIEAFLQRHGAALTPVDASALRQRYCPDGRR